MVALSTFMLQATTTCTSNYYNTHRIVPLYDVCTSVKLTDTTIIQVDVLPSKNQALCQLPAPDFLLNTGAGQCKGNTFHMFVAWRWSGNHVSKH